MDPVGGWTTIVVSVAVVLAAWFGLRGRAPVWMQDLGSAVGGAGIGLGGLLLLHGVDAATWVLTPVVMALGTLVHRRLLFAGAGPLRT